MFADHVFRRSPRESYWAVQRQRLRLARMLTFPDRTFAHHVSKDFARYLWAGVRQIPGETRERQRAAVDWLCRAQDATPDGGVSLGYFPCDEENGWRISYPETTGYIITSFLEFARLRGDGEVFQRALRMARWEVEIQMPSGAVQGGPVCAPDEQTPCAFNTGMVLDGWSSAYRSTRDPLFLESGRRAADFLLRDLSPDGYFKTNGQFVAPGKIKTYNCLCAWSLYRMGEDLHEEQYQTCAVKIVEAALRQQHANGWFANNCLTRSEAPLLHTIGYTLQGTLEVGVLAERPDFLAGAKRGVDGALTRLTSGGFLPGRFYSDWKPAALWSCLTGSAQLAVVCYRLYESLGDRKYWGAAERIVNYLKALQVLDSPDPGINGALAGSFPIFGEYMTAGFPNWATKYFLDGLILQDRLRGN
jgi:hypothetical protein